MAVYQPLRPYTQPFSSSQRTIQPVTLSRSEKKTGSKKQVNYSKSTNKLGSIILLVLAIKTRPLSCISLSPPAHCIPLSVTWIFARLHAHFNLQPPKHLTTTMEEIKNLKNIGRKIRPKESQQKLGELIRPKEKDMKGEYTRQEEVT